MNKTHGYSRTHFYKTWANMLYRCRHNLTCYKKTNVCPRWGSFDNFFEDMYVLYKRHIIEYGKRNTTIDRIDSNKDYSPSNCRWATYKTQAENAYKDKAITLNGKTYSLSEWIRKLGLNRSTVTYRIAKGMSYKQALYKGNYSRRNCA